MRPYTKKLKRGEKVRWKKANAVPASVGIKGQDRNWTPLKGGLKVARASDLYTGYVKFKKGTKGMAREMRKRVFGRLF